MQWRNYDETKIENETVEFPCCVRGVSGAGEVIPHGLGSRERNAIVLRRKAKRREKSDERNTSEAVSRFPGFSCVSSFPSLVPFLLPSATAPRPTLTPAPGPAPQTKSTEVTAMCLYSENVKRKPCKRVTE